MRVPILFFAACLGALHAQATVEYGLGAGRAATTAAPAKDLGKSIAGVLGSLDKTLKNAKSSAETLSITAGSSGAEAKPAAPPKIYEDIKKAEVGTDYDTLISRFGPASLEAAGEDGAKKLTYSGKDGTTRIEVKDGKVTAIDTLKPQASVLVLPK